jgi:hypothetical protein
MTFERLFRMAAAQSQSDECLAGRYSPKELGETRIVLSNPAGRLSVIYTNPRYDGGRFTLSPQKSVRLLY